MFFVPCYSVSKSLKRKSKFVHRGVFAFSLVLPLVMAAALGLLHVPFRAEPSAVAHFVSATTPTVSSWKAVHLLSVSCSCSRAVSAHLLQRGPFPGMPEYVVLVGNDANLAQSLSQIGFRVQSRSADEIADQFQIPGAPWFILVSPTQEIAYAGGYSVRRDARSGYQDQQIWRKAMAGFRTDALPVYGCALGKRLQRKADPFQLKYRN